MAKITELPLAAPITGAETIPVVQDDEMRRTTVAELREVTGLTGLLTQHPAAQDIGVAAPAAASGDYFGADMALAKVLPANTVIEGFDFALFSGGNVTIYAATATNAVGGYLTNASVIVPGPPLPLVGYAPGPHSLTADDLAPLGDLSGKILVLKGVCAFLEATAPVGDDQWVAINTATLAATLVPNRKIQMKVRYHTSDDHSGDLLEFTGAQIKELIAAAPSQNSLRMKRAVREYGFFPQPLSRAAAADIPTATVGASYANSAINGRDYAHPTVPLNSPKVTWLGGVPIIAAGTGAYHARGAFYAGPGGNYANQYASAEIEFSGTDIELIFFASFGAVANQLRLLVNDRIVAVHTLPTVDGAPHFLHWHWDAGVSGRLRVEGVGANFGGFNVADPAQVSNTGRDYPLVSLMGDSFAEGTGASNQCDGQAVSMLRACGFNPAVAAVGGTGIAATGFPGAGRVNWLNATRMLDLTLAGVIDARTGLPAAPAAGILCLSINDAGALTENQARDGVFTLADAWIAANPGKPLGVFGPTATNGETNLNLLKIRDGARNACFGLAPQGVRFFDRFGPNSLLRSGSATVVGDQANYYTGYNPLDAEPDPTHPNQRGHNLDALTMALDLRSWVLAELA